MTPVPGSGFAINQIQTPDEYATDTNNDAYTNAEAAQELQIAAKVASLLGKPVPPQWQQIATGLIQTMPVDKTHDIFLEHEGYKGEQIKQADVVMLTYPLNFSMPKSYGINDLNYYTPITDMNGPAMTDAIHSIAAAALNGPGCSDYTYTLRSYQPFLREPYLQFSEFAPIKLTATAYDFLTGVGGFMQEFLFGYSGLRFQEDAVAVDPNLPPQIPGLTLRSLKWQGRTFTMHIGPRQTTITLESGGPLPVMTPTGRRTVSRGTPLSLPTRRSDLQPTDNLARCHTITATSSAPGFPAVAAVDGSPSTVWSPETPDADLTLDLGAKIALGKITVVRGSKEPFSYTVQSSADGTSWNKLATSPSTSSGTDTFEPQSIQARYIRLTFAGAGPSKPSIAELAVKAP